MYQSSYEMILNKKLGRHHSKEELQRFAEKFFSGNIPDEEMAAWLMAVCFQSLNDEELNALTESMLRSGEQLKWDRKLLKGRLLVDKHSSGGVGDKTTLIVVPILGACGVPLVKLSGRALGHTGGTLDKLESIPGFRTDLSQEEIHAQMRNIGLYIGSQSKDLVPADKKLYALRDRTATVDSIPLIASSIMSKKLASGADAFVIDIKVGKGAFMQTKEEGKALAEAMASIATSFGKKVVCVLSRMDSPLGDIGNAVEITEALAILRGSGGHLGLKELCLVLASEMHSLCFNSQIRESRKKVEEALNSGDALRIFNRLIQAQGGKLQDFFHLEPEFTYDYYAKSSGIITGLDAKEFGLVGNTLGTATLGDLPLDPTSGFVFDRHVGDPVYAGQRIFQVRYEMNRAKFLEASMDRLDGAIQIEKNKYFKVPDPILEVMRFYN